MTNLAHIRMSDKAKEEKFEVNADRTEVELVSVKSEFKEEPKSGIMEGSKGVLKPKAYKEGEDPETFLRGFSRIAKANAWSEARQLAILPALFSESHEWLAQELEDNASITTMELAKERILQMLVPAEKRRAFLHQFMS